MKTEKQAMLDGMYMNIAMLHAKLSKAVRLKVGAVIVTKDQVMLGGYNGQPPGYDNCCEENIAGLLVTKPTVIHAELNAILKAAKEGVSVKDATVYVTHEPCRACSAMLKSVGIARLVYGESYISATSGPGAAELAGFISVEKLGDERGDS